MGFWFSATSAAAVAIAAATSATTAAIAVATWPTIWVAKSPACSPHSPLSHLGGIAATTIATATAAAQKEVRDPARPHPPPCLRIKCFTSPGKGGKNRRRGKNENESEKRELVFKEDGQEYVQVIKMLGNGRLEAMCFDGVKRLCHIRGKLREKVWINTSDIILVGLRDYEVNKADAILKYNADEARSLKAYGELPEHAKINETDTFGPGDDDEIQIDDIGDDDEDIDGI
ncbi:PREDICTED: eukaryotic translation initiation factor 1A, X-chromosomal-like [Elephantulus edwardii]|uniref:eukaryotic translation initiation factor 1A, X-chromosomal-like n=1 Tax=Elephantulus edwardii TaxID=28737 RepID=UPI0003F07067|nr:PREDICTED: eukaryotic translation initiation factor 1A, X-chromosomal-like [Elephantulus edwardii]